MQNKNITAKNIFSIKNEEQFNAAALEVFEYQLGADGVYRSYIKKLNINISQIKHYKDIPFLPIDFFKTHKIISSEREIQTTFRSSGTTGMSTSEHHIPDLKIYEESFIKTFELFYGNPEQYTFLALLPSYSERNDSSLIYMVEKLMQISNKKGNEYYLYNHEELFEKLSELENRKQKTILFGVSFALLDFFEKFKISLKNTTIIETGGMKGRKKEIVREELHRIIKNATGLKQIHSEYGMTELLSQAYAKQENKYITPPWMKILIRDTNDPFDLLPQGKSGGINIIDLANIYSCSFIETKDLGKIHKDNSFEVLGRFDNSDVRGCNLMVI
ncbi:MAG: acyltransferase [Bacteroidales bacterium]|nr:acyltransferase [Bacteroidales bacterium]